LITAGSPAHRHAAHTGKDLEADCGVLKFLRNHFSFPLAISFQIFSGVSGMSMCRTPSRDKASTTELTTAGEQPIVPASPTPLTPSGFTGDGVVVWSVSIQGIMWALGTA